MFSSKYFTHFIMLPKALTFVKLLYANTKCHPCKTKNIQNVKPSTFLLFNMF